MIRLVRRACPRLALVVPVLTLLEAPLPALQLYCWKRVIDGTGLWLQSGTRQDAIVLYLLLSLGITLLMGGLDALTRLLERLLNLRLTHHIQAQVLGHANTLDLAFFELPSFYDKLERAQQDATLRPYMALSSLITAGRQLVALGGYLVPLVLFSWWSLPCLLIATLPGFLVQLKFGQLTWAIGRRRTPEQRRMNYYLHLMTSGYAAKEMRLFGLARYLMPRWRELFGKFYRQDRGVGVRQHLAEFCIQTLQALAATAFYGFVIYRTVADAGVTIGGLFLLTQAMQFSMQSVAATLGALATLYQSNLYFGNLFEYLVQQPSIRPPAVACPVPQPIRNGIRFEAVHFAYPTGAREVLTDVSFEILPGERIAIVGENGSGKTTLIKLLARLYDPRQGRITVDGIDLRQESRTALCVSGPPFQGGILGGPDTAHIAAGQQSGYFFLQPTGHITFCQRVRQSHRGVLTPGRVGRRHIFRRRLILGPRARRRRRFPRAGGTGAVGQEEHHPQQDRAGHKHYQKPVSR